MTRLVLALVLASPAYAQEAPSTPAPAPTLSVEEALAPLEAAYQKEFAYLSAEKEGLEARIAAQDAEGRRARASSETELDQLEARMTALQVRVEQTEARLSDVDRAAEAAIEADDALSAGLFQARNSLEGLGVELAETTEDLPGRGAGFAAAFAAGMVAVAQGSEVRAVPGAFFGPDGSAIDGTLVEVGNVATFGASDGESFALVPVGEGRLQAWREGGGATGTALLDGTKAPAMGLYLHEGRTKRIEERQPKTWGDILEAGGTVGYVILALGVVALLLMAARILVLVRAGAGQSEVDQAVEHLITGRVDEAYSLVDRQGGSAPRVVKELLRNAEGPRDGLDEVANAAILTETPRVERFGSAILVIAAVAPLLGLLGTVTGMIATFDIITEYGTGDPRMLSGGISAALVTTQFGLIVAIPALLAGNLLAGWGETVLGRTEAAALRVLNALGGDPLPDGQPDRLAQASK